MVRGGGAKGGMGEGGEIFCLMQFLALMDHGGRRCPMAAMKPHSRLLGCDFFRKYTDMQIHIRTRRNNFFQMLIIVFRWCLMIISYFFAILLAPDTQISRYADRCSRLLAIDACLFTKIDFLLSRMSTKIDFCGATGHDHGGW